ncbi:hypothetical protein N7478_006511 [Penicillium angulare]|uniref:uncharacterized protein n=1 Tax=Penicillium angulare TaxID=116970 RepID=UPI002540B578|nr:uncharacterized protein N7478_006511 [Penicillium angulare]KAJ5281139.1 hypothetical protein N7478_006511 [Penicillium angulare]
MDTNWESPRDWGNENQAPGEKKESGDGNWGSGDGGGGGGGGGFDNNACRRCGGTDHFARNCPNDDNDNGYSDSSRACYNCGQTGHNKADCPEPRKASGACFNCGKEGHSKADCPEPRKGDGACYNCGQKGHSKADCPEPRKMGACFNCGEEGHSKVYCPKPREFKGTCRLCEKEGHPAALCPERPPDICRNCKAEGHLAKDCTSNRKFDLNHIADLMPEEAWSNMKAASDEKEIQEFREALQVYSKAVPLSTYADIEKKMREGEFKIHLIALEKEPVDVMSLIDLQGQRDREYVVGFFLAAKPLRKHLLSRWPSDPANNLERLANAGLPFDREIIKCRNCGELGHLMKACKEERREFDRVEIKCSNCDEVGHRVRDCKQPRKSRGGCRNCGSGEHIAKDCPKPRSAAGVECRRCNETGHFAKDCPNVEARPRRTCRNCGSEDHIARDCDQPRDPSTMTCRNCDKVGHTDHRCPQPAGESGFGDSYQNNQSSAYDAWGAATGGDQHDTSQDDGHGWNPAYVAEEENEESNRHSTGPQW